MLCGLRSPCCLNERQCKSTVFLTWVTVVVNTSYAMAPGCRNYRHPNCCAGPAYLKHITWECTCHTVAGDCNWSIDIGSACHKHMAYATQYSVRNACLTQACQAY